MLYLIPNTSGQSLYVTAYEGRALLDESFTDYLVVLNQTLGSESFAFIANVETDNYRYSKFLIDTDDDDPTNGNLLVPENISGTFSYTIYGQNSSTNLDPLDSVVVGVIEIGTLIFVSETEYYNQNNIPIPIIESYGG